ncbi:MAG: hypothetical protein Fur0037_17810 [Planctomycetota bacterium]
MTEESPWLRTDPPTGRAYESRRSNGFDPGVRASGSRAPVTIPGRRSEDGSGGRSEDGSGGEEGDGLAVVRLVRLEGKGATRAGPASVGCLFAEGV